MSAETPEITAILNPGRMLSDGVPYPDFREALETVSAPNEWFDFWWAKGEAYQSIGERALAAGNSLSGGEWLWYGALSFHYAQFMWFHDPGRRELGQRRKVELYNRAAPHLRPAAHRVELPFRGHGDPRLPARPQRHATAFWVALRGLDRRP
jgi:2,6-dihydroxypseudooxynicotine hydrolase